MLTSLLALSLAPSYRIVDLGVPQGAEKAEAVAINNRGEVLVRARAHGYLWRAGRYLALVKSLDGPSDESSVEPRALNDLGTVVGGFGEYSAVFGTGLLGREAFLWKGHGLTRIFEAGRIAEARDLNERGVIVGQDFWRGFVRTGGRVREIPSLSHVGAGNRADAMAINNHGEILGASTYGGGTEANESLPSRPYLASTRTLRPHPLPLPRGCVDGAGLDLNDKGTILARAWFGGRRWSPYLIRRGKIVRLDYPEGQYFDARLNLRGDVVGTIEPEGPGSLLPQSRSRPVLWLSEGRTRFPNFVGWTLQTATGINDKGQICGTGLHDGKTHAYVLTLN